MKYKILIIYVSAGGGHRSASLAISKACELHKDISSVKVIDALDYTNPTYKKLYLSTYLNLVKYSPEFWGYLYRKSDKYKRKPSLVNLQKSLDNISFRKLEDFIIKFNPDIIIGTHYLPLQIGSKLKNKIGALLAGVVTDFTAHSLWYQKNVNIYFVANSEVMREINRLGQPISQVKITGIPIDLKFLEQIDKNIIRKELGLKKDISVLLLLSGGYGVGPIKDFIVSINKSGLPVQMITVIGQNEKLTKEIRKISGSNNKVFGFVTNINELMDASDIIATKPGGLTSSEILAKHKPMIILDPIPGQEQRNCEYLLEQGTAVRLHDPADAPHKIRELIGNKQKLINMSINAQRIAKPNASKEIIKEILEYCENSQKRIREEM